MSEQEREDPEYERIGRILAVQRACARYPAGTPFGASEIAKKVGLPKNTTWRILKGLAHHHFITETVVGGKFFHKR